MTDRDVDAPDAGPDERDQTMAHSPTRVAAAALLGAAATSLVAVPAPADAAQPCGDYSMQHLAKD